jgi:AraC-like DNA-binding protein
MDVLSDVFETLQLRGCVYFRTDFSPPWGTTVPSLGRTVRFHYVVQGCCWIRVAGSAPMLLSAGDFVLVPNGASHVLSHDGIEEAPPLETVLEAAGYRGELLLAIGNGDPAAATQLVCGHLNFAEGADHTILRVLPPMIRISNAERSHHPWFDGVLQLLVTQVFSQHPGSVAAVTRLSEILFIEAIRFAGDEAPELQRLMQGFSDAQIGRAIAAIHRELTRSWTVASLAREAGMSRTRFARRFHELIGMGPAGYLTEWRLQRSMTVLATTRRTVSEIARACGYASPAAFTRAFAERFGQTPKQFRVSGAMRVGTRKG